MRIKLDYIPLSTEEWRLLRAYMDDKYTEDANIVEYKKQIRANRERSLQEAMDMHFRITPTGFMFEMEGTL